ncbi:hypothetical protein Sked_28540 [Sanguibacter keddieii DSM 10542]|uniref:Right handed beta helix domain-containing protein n=1 Tax=Sanguibacter keddieii (strain ATCC 51767 / DSM 10542 / NCFB 3025 / ST-74) TaxID=446469 RepID=D1BBI5_SANKS|nr:right-handed parallel beta-helix repeat-containing protein [Sanguibacter keddieii]ACZ22756.1 hypothetical protein Sked_28540 [Sanguibacter keddieii DSM 10542]
MSARRTARRTAQRSAQTTAWAASRGATRTAGVLAVAIVCTLVGSAAAATSAGAATPAPAPALPSVYPGDPDAEAALVAAEDRRLVEVRSIANGAQWTGASQWRPYRLETGTTYTLVLVEREAPYSFDDLLELAPQTLVRQPDGSYLLGENIVVEEGATLDLTSDDGLRLNLTSTDDAFVSIVTLGGDLTVAGTAENPTVVSAWDPRTGTVDTDTSDGRAYVRVIGGYADLRHATFDHLGFWSGTTGGVSLTGTDLPHTAPGSQALTEGTVPAPEDATAGTADPAAADPADPAPTTGTVSSPAVVPPATVFGKELLPTGAGAPTLGLGADLSGYSFVSAQIQDVTFSDNAFGLFVMNAEGVVVSGSRIEDSLVDGLVMHRDVTASTVVSTTSTGNAVDGFRLARSTSGIVLERLTSTGNGRNGISIEGTPLADGPSATGTGTAMSGANSVSESTVTGNGRYGIDVVGGTTIEVDANTVTDNPAGIVVSEGATAVTLTDNTVEGAGQQGISLRSAGTDAQVTGNTVLGGEIGIYARDAGGTFERNTVDDVTNHAITLVGATGGSVVSDNTVGGRGPSAIDVARTTGVTVSDNSTDGWDSTKPLSTVLRQIFQPLTVVWLLLALLVLVTALTSIRHRNAGVRHPYANRAPLTSLTRGVADPAEIFGTAVRPAAAPGGAERDPGPSRARRADVRPDVPRQRETGDGDPGAPADPGDLATAGSLPSRPRTASAGRPPADLRCAP